MISSSSARHPGLAGSMWADTYTPASTSSDTVPVVERKTGLSASIWATPEPAPRARAPARPSVPTLEQIFQAQNTSMNAAEVAATASQIAQPRYIVVAPAKAINTASATAVSPAPAVSPARAKAIATASTTAASPARAKAITTASTTAVSPAPAMTVPAVSPAPAMTVPAVSPAPANAIPATSSKASTSTSTLRPQAAVFVARQIVGSALGVQTTKE